MSLARRSAFLLLALSVLAPGWALHAQTACSAATWNGAHGYTLSGFVYDDQGYLYMLGAVGRMVSDGAGNLTGSDSFSFDGSVVKREFTGTYTVNEDCTGALTLTNAAGASVHADIVIVSGGKEILLLETDGGYILTGTLKQQYAGSASGAADSESPQSRARSGH